MGAHGSDVADVVQETFMAAARAAPAYDPSRAPLWLWLWGIARNHVAQYFRKAQRYDRLLKAEAWMASHNGELVASREGMPTEILESAELATLVRVTLTELPPDYELLLTAKYLDGDSVEQIATQERSSSSAVRSKLARARQAFREAFEARSQGAAARSHESGAK
jgi:RNA polymerase sigma-70 factor (ECF subfamily)